MKYFILISILFLSACAGRSGLNLGQYPDPHASYDSFEYCHGYGCTKKIRIGFNNHEWKQISKIFEKPAKNALAERVKIGEAISLMETYSAKLAGTEEDLAKAPFRRKSYFELDCIDETINTTKYLGFLAQANFLKFHSVSPPAFRGLNKGMYPHNTAVVTETETRTAYVIDSYIYKNGTCPDIRPLDNWMKYRVEELGKAERLNRL